MCVPGDAEPPIPSNGAAVETSDLVLTASDGVEFAAFEAVPKADGGSAVIVLPDVRGLFHFYEELAVRFAEAGHHSVAIDYFGRTAGVAKRDNDWDFMPHVEQVTHEGLRADVSAAIDRIRLQNSSVSIFTVGFCFGGSNSWHQAANGLGLAGAVGFYGRPTFAGRPLGAASVVDRLGDVECSILALMGGDDPSIPAETIAEFEAALGEASITHEVVTYDGAPHSFFDRSYDEHADASADAWSRVLGFIEENR